MRKLFPVLMVMVMLIQFFSKTIIFASFKINQDYIAKNFCENRSQPQKHCLGKCHLLKQLQKDEEKQDSKLPNSQKNYDEVVFLNENSASGRLMSVLFNDLLFSNVDEKIFPVKREDVFRPPSFCC